MATDEEYERAVEKGTVLLQLLLANDAEAGQMLDLPQQSAQSTFASVQDLIVHGYTGKRTTSCILSGREAIMRLSTALQALGLNPEMACDGGANFVVEHKHSEDRTFNSVNCPATHANLTQICNHTDGVLIAHSNHSATHVGVFQEPPITAFPPLSRWSDIAYLQWLTTSTFTPSQAPVPTSSPTPIKFIFRLSIQNAATFSILNTIMAKKRRLEYPMWPGVTFDIASEEGKAIMGTPNGAGTAWLLIQRKKDLGHQRIEKVTVFYAEDVADMWRFPSLLFWVV
ncbi:hypothetical protein CC86DRAFT_416728 [Ophiobolus disseminans]|uniref:Uncharacterized protein n=1 Tax=Ophiobolus disseminans TaxID=1469910 RepID=A0A6A7A2D1_9PLEO|nr:hypothetical protein CC86DRAFT_416728 [Ophiobolus disseminans]